MEGICLATGLDKLFVCKVLWQILFTLHKKISNYTFRVFQTSNILLQIITVLNNQIFFLISIKNEKKSVAISALCKGDSIFLKNLKECHGLRVGIGFGYFEL